MGSFGSLSCEANVMPGFEFGFVELAKGAFASDEKACWASLAASIERTVPFSFVVDMVAVARDSFREEGCVKVRAAMVGLSVKRREERCWC